MITRRKFLTKAGGIGIALYGASFGIRGLLRDVESAEELAPIPDLVVTKNSSPSTLVRKSVDALGGIKRFVSRGDVVVVKPNIGWDRTPEQAANTNPEVVLELIKMAYEAGAKKVKVFDRTCNEPERCYINSGIAKIVRSVDGEISHVSDRGFIRVDLPRARLLKSWLVYKEALEADVLINVPVAKHHGLTGVTLAMKNWMGFLGDDRGKIHQDIHQNLADINTLFKAKLTVIDAIRILVANGPSGGNLDDVRKLDTIIASTDCIAADSYGATLFGLKGSDLGYVRNGYNIGLGEIDLTKLKIRIIDIGKA